MTIVNTSNPDAHSNINEVVKLSLTLPLSRAASLMHLHLSKQTTETSDPKQALDMWMKNAYRRINQGQGGAPAASSSSTMQEAEAEDSGGH
ncbi:hypothetical protein EYF80_027574 [Liparis tanakae]|uniref:Uncharacterized protein n=1 Tax=Liparis tanakae TaxID=230148 RepID=A0A4Z2HBD3_9TELE|nr:hypothetical protein EYF80_027574 [Liparis tanakae]